MSITRRTFCRSALTVPAAVAVLVHESPADPVPAAPTPPRANYMLRYLMRSNTARQQTEDLIVYCHENHIPEVILFSANNWDMGWNLPTLEEAETRVEVLRPVFKRLRAVGLRVSINMMSTIGQLDMGRDERNRFPWQCMIGDDGTETRTAACPIDPRWKSYVGQLYTLFSQLEPEIIYIDDDFRYHNHRQADWGCFCPLHLDEMARRTGKRLSREELVHRICSAWPQPTEERKQWLGLCGDSILEATRIISDAVKAASPKTHMGLMTSEPNTHAAEGRRWLDMVEAFSVSGNRPVLRPHYASYQDGIYRDAAANLTCMRKLQPLLGAKMRITPELENSPDSRFAKSVRLTRLQMALSFFLASPDITVDIHGIETGFNYDTAHDQVLRNSYDYFSAITAWAAECPKERGLQLLWDDRFPLHRRVGVDRIGALNVPFIWEGGMDLMGFATTFFPEEVKLASRPYLEERTDGEIRELLKGKLLLDGDAATFLVERGFGAQIGLRGIQPLSAANFESLVNPEFAGKYANQEESLVESSKFRLEPAEQAILVTRMYGPERSFSAPGMMLFENSDGGRIGLIPLDGSQGDLVKMGFATWRHQHVLRKMLEWISQGPLPLFVEDAANVCPLRRDGAGLALVGIANLTPDTLPQLSFRVAPLRKGRSTVECLGADGKLAPVDVQVQSLEGYLQVRAKVTVQPLDFVCFRIRLV